MNKFDEIKKSYLYNIVNKSRKKLENNEPIYDIFKDIFSRIDAVIEKPLKLAVLGEFSAGKSSFINRLIGMEILPTGVIPVTSTVTVLEYGEEEKVEIVYKGHDGSKVTKQYEGYTKLFDFQKTKPDNNNLLQVVEIRVFIKNDILKFFHIIDTPGFNDSNNMSEVTETIFKDVNYVLWLFNATQAGKKTEKKYLNKLKEHSKYKDNIYAIINYGDVAASNEEEYHNVVESLLDEDFQMMFTNEKPMMISSLKTDDFWKAKFNHLEKELREKILKRDKEISEIQQEQEKENLIEKISIVLSDTETVLKTIKSDFISFIESSNENHKNSDEIKAKLFKIIQHGVEAIEKRLKGSSVYENPLIDSSLKFFSFYATAENLEKMQDAIEDEYKHYIENFNDTYNEFKGKTSSTIHANISYDSSYIDSLDKKFEAISSNLKVLEKNKKLLIVGYIIGVFSDDYIYNLLNNKSAVLSSTTKSAVKSLSDGTIYNLLKMDLDITYFIEELKLIENEIDKKLNDDIVLLNDALKELKG